MARTIGSIAIDDNVNAFCSEVIIPSTRSVQRETIDNRMGRVTRIKEDQKPLVIDLRGTWVDGGGRYWRDFKAALLGQSRVAFTLGDGTRYEMVDVDEIAETKLLQSLALTAAPSVAYAYTAKVASYEPFAREIAPTLQSLGAVSSGPTGPTTTFAMSYPGTAFSEPTWQLSVSQQAGNVISSVVIANTTSGEQTTVAGTAFQPGIGITQYMLLDASGAALGVNGGSIPSPNNGQYGLLAIPSMGYGVTVGVAGSTADVDFVGNIPTLIESPAPSLPPAPYTNTITVQVFSTSALTACSLSVLAPARYMR